MRITELIDELYLLLDDVKQDLVITEEMLRILLDMEQLHYNGKLTLVGGTDDTGSRVSEKL